MIYFFGDVHGKFGHMERAVAEHRPEAIILLGDILDYDYNPSV